MNCELADARLSELLTQCVITRQKEVITISKLRIYNWFLSMIKSR